MSGLQCRGDETNINQCKQNILGVSDCNHWEDAGIICSGKASGISSGFCVRFFQANTCHHNWQLTLKVTMESIGQFG